MKMINKLIYTFVLLFSFSAVYAQSFEGTITMTQESPGRMPFSFTWYIKDGQLAYTSNTSEGDTKVDMRVVFDKGANVLKVTVNGQEMEVAAKDIQPSSWVANAGRPVVVNEGRGESPFFDETLKYTISTTQTVSKMEVSPEVPVSFKEYAAFFKADPAMTALAQSGQPGFPVKVITKDTDGNIISKITVESVERKSLDDSIFK